MHKYRTHKCNELNKNNTGEQVRVSGWVHSKRDHGNLLFIDLRDHYGITQCVLDISSPLFPVAEQLRVESVITITGKVIARADEAVNKNHPTGEVEVTIEALDVESHADVLPFPVNTETPYSEEIRLQHRFLDLRRQTLHNNIVLRSNVIKFIRSRMIDQGFMEFQTPILTASSPEGARDFLVPARHHPGKFYALPQAPQQFKQLIMCSGFDRYFQIAPCFRDEDARADRAPGEFYQLDVEMAYVTQEDVFSAIEPIIKDLYEEFGSKQVIQYPFPRIPYLEAMAKYGSDKPDLRNPIELVDVTAPFDGGSFGLFATLIGKGAKVYAIHSPQSSSRPRSYCDKLNSRAKKEGYGGLGYMRFDENGTAIGPIAQNLEPERVQQIKEMCNIQPGDDVFFSAGKPSEALKFAGVAREWVCDALEIRKDDGFYFCWIVDFPMYELDDNGKLDFSHNPFSMPQGGMDDLLNKDPLDILAWQYDIVCNGIELSSGAIRNHKPEVMYKAFELAGYENSVVDDKFGGMINAFKYGAPPHGGIAPGIDRMVMQLANQHNIREVILFPMTQKAEDLMMKAPAEADSRHLKELHIGINMPAKPVVK